MEDDVWVDAVATSEGDVRQAIWLLSSGSRKPMSAHWYHRELVVTDFQGNCGHAGTVLCVNGSPPKGTVIAWKEGHFGVLAYDAPQALHPLALQRHNSQFGAMETLAGYLRQRKGATR